MIDSIIYERLYNLGNYENEKLGVIVSVVDGDVNAAFDEARAAVEAEHARRHQPKSSSEPPATSKQISYIGRLQEDLCWTSEQLSVYAAEQDVNLVTMSMRQASTFINGLKKLAEERSDATRPPPLADGYLPF